VIELTVPPLRDRRDELPSLIEFFVSRSTEQYRRPAPAFSSELQATFQRYEWPGNIRELENMIKRIVILQDEEGVVRKTASRTAGFLARNDSGDQPLALGSDEVEGVESDDSFPQGSSHFDATGSRLFQAGKAAALAAERTMIEDALRREQWNRRRAAVRLGVSYKTLLTKIKESGVLAKIA